MLGGASKGRTFESGEVSPHEGGSDDALVSARSGRRVRDITLPYTDAAWTNSNSLRSDVLVPTLIT